MVSALVRSAGVRKERTAAVNRATLPTTTSPEVSSDHHPYVPTHGDKPDWLAYAERMFAETPDKEHVVASVLVLHFNGQVPERKIKFNKLMAGVCGCSDECIRQLVKQSIAEMEQVRETAGVA